MELLKRGGWHANHAITVADDQGAIHHMVLRRWARPGWELSDPDFTAEREAEVLMLLAREGMPTPCVIAADAQAIRCDVPALLITRLPGMPRARVDDEASLRQLAETLARVHSINVGLTAVPSYRTYVDLHNASIPAWLASPVWKRAIQAVQSQPHRSANHFIHRDFHPGNTLWSRQALVGVVDWTQASVGPLEVDVGHMRWNLAAEYNEDVADHFLSLYEAAVQTHLEAQPYWDLVTLLDLVLDVESPLPPGQLERLEMHASTALGELY